MQKRTREILALVLLGVLAIVAAFAMGYYILVGHNWNVAASNIDDRIGQMDDYTVFLYEGTRKAPESKGMASKSQGSSASQSRSSSQASRESELRKKTVSLDDVAKSYREKGATVFILKSDDFDFYSEPFVVAKEGKRVGLFSAQRPVRKTVVRRVVRDFTYSDANVSIMLTNDRKTYRSGFKGVSVIVCNYNFDSVPDGEYHGSSYCVSVPYKGQVGAVIMSPSGVLSYKTITEL